ncbi:MAG TPA: amidohydrolase family protein [Vicinamibacteria bacterium]|nr:amidohydrolase family protein [Vicinamibacteria bacterium]
MRPLPRSALAFSPLPAAGLALAAALSLAAPPAPTVTVSARRALDLESGRFVLDPVIRIEDGTITAVDTRRPGEAVTHDLGDATLLPGLIDCHTHLVGGEELTPYDDLRETAARAAIEGVRNARVTVEAGFTTVRDLGSRDFADVALRDAIAAGRVVGPRMLVAVKSLSVTGGHGDLNALPSDVRVLRYSAIADGPEEILKKVRENVKYGADWIKLLATGGVMSAGTDPRTADYTEEEIRAAVVAAAAKGRDVAVHAHGTEGIKRAARAGVRSIEHSSMLDDEAVALVKERGVFLVPNPQTNAYMIERGPAGGYQDYQLAKGREVLGLKMESLRKAVRAGLLVAYGTDAGVQPHGLNAGQLGMYVEAGMSPLQALQSATLVAARLLRREDRLGRLARGYAGDVVAVRGNPLEDLRTVGSPVFVMKDGRVVKDAAGR